MTGTDLLGMSLLLALVPMWMVAAVRYSRRATREQERRNVRALVAVFGPRLGRGHVPPADGRWYRMLRESHRGQAHDGDGHPTLVSEFWIADSEGRQWHCVLECDWHGEPRAPLLVPLSASPAWQP
jgi:hypothetical protein